MESKFRAKTNAIIARNKSSYYNYICFLSVSYFLIAVFLLMLREGGRERGRKGFSCPKKLSPKLSTGLTQPLFFLPLSKSIFT
jgi:hypothetical protein